MKKIYFGLLLGALAGVIDVTPMILQGLPLSADLSAFCFWIIAGFVIATSNLKLNGIIKGILISYLLLVPVGIIIAFTEPLSLVPMSIMTLVLGGGLGYFISTKLA